MTGEGNGYNMGRGVVVGGVETQRGCSVLPRVNVCQASNQCRFQCQRQGANGVRNQSVKKEVLQRPPSSNFVVVRLAHCSDAGQRNPTYPT